MCAHCTGLDIEAQLGNVLGRTASSEPDVFFAVLPDGTAIVVRDERPSAPPLESFDSFDPRDEHRLVQEGLFRLFSQPDSLASPEARPALDAVARSLGFDSFEAYYEAVQSEQAGETVTEFAEEEETDEIAGTRIIREDVVEAYRAQTGREPEEGFPSEAELAEFLAQQPPGSVFIDAANEIRSWTDYSNFAYAAFVYGNGEEYVVLGPQLITQHEDGTALVYDDTGDSHYIEAGFLAVRARAKPGKPNFAF